MGLAAAFFGTGLACLAGGAALAALAAAWCDIAGVVLWVQCLTFVFLAIFFEMLVRSRISRLNAEKSLTAARQEPDADVDKVLRDCVSRGETRRRRMDYNKLSVEDLQPKGKRVFVRVDFNVPQDENLNITDDTRIRESLKTIQYLSDKGAKVILAAHLGRPKGKKNEKYSLKPAAVRLSELIHKPVLMMPDCVGDAVKAEIAKKRLQRLNIDIDVERPLGSYSVAIQQLVAIARALVNLS